MAVESRWFRVNTDWSDATWLEDLPWPVRAVWIEFLAFVKEQGMRGRCKVIRACKLGGFRMIPEECVQALLDAAIAAGAVTVRDGYWCVTRWDEYQDGDYSTERVKRHRKNNETVTTVSETEKDPFETNETVETALLCRAETTDPRPQTESIFSGENISLCEKERKINPLNLVSANQNTQPPRGRPPGSKNRGKPEKPRTVMEVYEAMLGIGLSPGDAQTESRRFMNHYDANGWYVGKVPMRDWRASVRNWEVLPSVIGPALTSVDGGRGSAVDQALRLAERRGVGGV